MRTSKKTNTKTNARNCSTRNCSTRTSDCSTRTSNCAGSRKCTKTKDCK